MSTKNEIPIRRRPRPFSLTPRDERVIGLIADFGMATVKQVALVWRLPVGGALTRGHDIGCPTVMIMRTGHEGRARLAGSAVQPSDSVRRGHGCDAPGRIPSLGGQSTRGMRTAGIEETVAPGVGP